MDRPTSASTTATLSRPSTATSTVNSQNVFMQARVRLGDDENDPPVEGSEKAGAVSTECTTEANETTKSASKIVDDTKIDDAKKKQPYKLDGSAPEIATKLEDVVDDLPDHILSRYTVAHRDSHPPLSKNSFKCCFI